MDEKLTYAEGVAKGEELEKIQPNAQNSIENMSVKAWKNI